MFLDNNKAGLTMVSRNITIVDPKFSYGQGVIIGSEVDSLNLITLHLLSNTFQDLPMKNIVFDGVRVLQAENSDLEKYHTCKGNLQNSIIKRAMEKSKLIYREFLSSVVKKKNQSKNVKGLSYECKLFSIFQLQIMLSFLRFSSNCVSC